ncbi:hypothetical protein pb186bvf_009672 [Paramecium bursaria]
MKNQQLQISNFQQVLNISQDQIVISTNDKIIFIDNSKIEAYNFSTQYEYCVNYYFKNQIIIREVGKISIHKKAQQMQLKMVQIYFSKQKGVSCRIKQSNNLIYLIQNSIFQQFGTISVTILIKKRIIRNLRTNFHLSQRIYFHDVVNNFIILNDQEQNQISLRQVVNFQKIIINIPHYQFINHNFYQIQIQCSQDLQFFLVTLGNESILFDQNGEIRKIFVYGQIKFSKDSRYIVVMHHLGHIGKFELYYLKDQKFIKNITFDDNNVFENADIIVLVQEQICFKIKSEIYKKIDDINCIIVPQSIILI